MSERKRPSIFDNESKKDDSLKKEELTGFNKKKKSTSPSPSPLKNFKFLPKLFSSNEKKIIVLLILIAIGFGGYLIFKNTGYTLDYQPQEGGTYTEGVVGEPEYLNPILSQARDVDQDISSLIYSGLMKYNEKQELVPDLAESYEVSEDLKNYTFKLKEGIFWHDGTEFTANDVVFTVHTIKNDQVKSPLLPSFSGVAVEKIDDRTVKLTLTKDVYTPFLAENTTFGILPKHIWEEISPESLPLSEANIKPVGTGPFKFKEYKKDKKSGSIIDYTLERNDDYYGNKPYLKYITFNFYMDWDIALEAYKKKEVLGVSFIPEESKDLITEKFEKEINYYHLRLPRYYAIFFNWDQNPYLSIRNVRRAISHLIDREKIINEALKDEARPVTTAILPNFLGYNPDTPGYEYSKEKAAEELDKAGYKLNQEDNIRYKNDQKLEFTLTVNDQESFIKTAEIIKESLDSVGIVCHIEALDPTTLQTEVIKPRSYDALLYGQLLMHDPDPYPFWHSTRRTDPGTNLSSYKNGTVDDLLETARKTVDENERAQKYQHFQNLISEDIPAIFLYQTTYPYSVSKKVHGIELESITLLPDRFAGINKWYIKTKPTLVKK